MQPFSITFNQHFPQALLTLPAAMPSHNRLQHKMLIATCSNQVNPFSTATNIDPPFVTPIIPPMYGHTAPAPLCWGSSEHPTPPAPAAENANLIKVLVDARGMTRCLNGSCPNTMGTPYSGTNGMVNLKAQLTLTDDVKLTYLKTLVTIKAKTAIAEFTYCGAMYKNALRTLECKFGQPQVAVSADKLNSFPPLKMHNRDFIINYSGCISSLVGVFKSLSYDSDLKSAALLNTAVQNYHRFERVMVTLHCQKALGETYSSGL